MPTLSRDDHRRYEEAVVAARTQMGRTHALLIDGTDLATHRVRAKHSPVDRGLVLGQFAAATEHEVGLAITAAVRAFPAWSDTAESERRGVVRRFLEAMEARAFEIAAVLSLELGKTRREALREVWGTGELLLAYCDEWASHGFATDAGEPRRDGTQMRMRPHGAWTVFAPFHHPFALGAGPVAAALLAGNTAVLKAAEETPWTARLFADLLRDAGVPAGVFNLISGSPEDMGAAMFGDPRIAGTTFTGSIGAGRALAKQMTSTIPPRPCIVEFTTKAARIVTAEADLDEAAASIARAAFHLAGQRASAPSHLLVHAMVADALIARIAAHARSMRVGDPTLDETDIGPLVSAVDLADYRQVAHQLHAHGAKVHFGAEALSGGGRGAGNFVAPTLAEVPRDDHPCWTRDLLLPVLMMRRYTAADGAAATIARLERSRTVEVHGSAEERDYFRRALEKAKGFAPPGATTAWPALLPSMRAEAARDDAVPSLHAYLARYLHPVPGRAA